MCQALREDQQTPMTNSASLALCVWRLVLRGVVSRVTPCRQGAGPGRFSSCYHAKLASEAVATSPMPLSYLLFSLLPLPGLPLPLPRLPRVPLRSSSVPRCRRSSPALSTRASCPCWVVGCSLSRKAGSWGRGRVE